MISEDPQTTSSTNSHLSHIPSRFLKPTIFLSSKQNSTKPLFHDIKTPDQAKYFQKHFGHKVMYVERYTECAAVLRSRKLLQRISFDKDICKKDGFKSSHDMIILANDISTPTIFSKKVLKGFRGKLSLAFKPETSNIAKYIKSNLYHLQSLEIILDKIEQFGFHKRTFDGLKSLESFSLSFDPKFERDFGWYFRGGSIDFDPNSYQQNPLSFVLLILQKIPLKRLKLDLAPYPVSSFALSYLLLFIEQANIPEWYVRSGMVPEAFIEFALGKDVQSNPNFPLHFKNSSEALQKVDFFGLYVINYILECRDEEWHSDECGSKEFSPPILSKLPQLTSKSHKVLDITLTDKLKNQVLLLSSLLENFISLEGLYIKARENALKFDKDSDRPPQNNPLFMRNLNPLLLKMQALVNQVQPERESEPKNLPWMKNLKHALLSIVDAEYEDRRSYRSHKPFEDLMRHLKDHCTTLESLNVFYATTEYKNNHGVTARRQNSVKVPCKSLTGFQSLQGLEINSDENGLTGVTETLRSLKNLRKLRQNFCDNVKPFTLGEKGSRWNDQGENIFDGLGQLREFELYIRPDQSDIGPSPLHWVRYFTKNLHKLQNLEVLKVFDSKETKVETEVLLGLLKALCQFTNLREIVIHSKIAMNVEALEMAADLSGDTPENMEDRVIELLKSKVELIINKNSNLKLVDIRSFKDTKLDIIFYKTN